MSDDNKRHCDLCNQIKKFGAWEDDGISGGSPDFPYFNVSKSVNDRITAISVKLGHLYNDEMNKFPDGIYWVCRKCRDKWMDIKIELSFPERDKLLALRRIIKCI